VHWLAVKGEKVPFVQVLFPQHARCVRGTVLESLLHRKTCTERIFNIMQPDTWYRLHSLVVP
jgi:hypothetical protein